MKLTYVEFNDLLNKTFTSISRTKNRDGNDAIKFVTQEGVTYLLTHEQECCESVNIADLCGDLDDLVGYPMRIAEHASDSVCEDDMWVTGWTFYKLGTAKGFVTIRWEGESSVYYGIGVDLIKYE